MDSKFGSRIGRLNKLETRTLKSKMSNKFEVQLFEGIENQINSTFVFFFWKKKFEILLSIDAKLAAQL